MDVLYLAGRIAFSLVFIANGIGHFAATDQMAGYTESKGLKPGKPLVLISGAGLLLGGLAIAFGIWTDLAALLLSFLLLSIAVLMHPFWRESGQERMMEQTQFFKDFSLAGAALLLFGFTQSVAHPLSITGPFFT